MTLRIGDMRPAWAHAINCADAGDFGELTRLLLAGEAIPVEYRQAVADFACGQRVPVRRRGQKARLTPARVRQARQWFAAITADDPECGYYGRTHEEAFALIARALGVSEETARDAVQGRHTYARRAGEK
jgi:hypothetical protein